VVESAPADTIFSRPNHPYTQALLQSEPKLEVGKRVFIPVKGEIPSPLNPPTGCHFHPRCPKALAQCASVKPPLRLLGDGHWSACHLNGQP
jgi:peptide/nickel transport system ATP-binding protein